MDAVSRIIIPFFALIFFGYAAGWRGWVPPASVPAFNGFLLYFAVPALLFAALVRLPTLILIHRLLLFPHDAEKQITGECGARSCAARQRIRPCEL